MRQDVVIVLDCGATNVRAIAVNTAGEVVAKAAVTNATEPAREHPEWHQWSLEAILARFTHCCRELQPALAGCEIRAVTVTTFGVDGALVDKDGKLLYPIISWKCPRTVTVMEQIRRYLDPEQLQRLSGVGQFGFNTLYKLIWLREQHPELVERAHAWLFISSLINHRLTGKMTTDRTMAGTSQLLSLQQECFSRTILEAVDLPEHLFPPMVAAGEVIGSLLPDFAERLGLPAGIPVVSAGHDTQFALAGSGAGSDQPVLSSGTWEILMVRTPLVDSDALARVAGSTCELDADRGQFNPGLQWLASGVLEWVRTLGWPEGGDYEAMIDEARAVPVGCDGVRMATNLLANGVGHGQGAFTGLSLSTRRGHLYRAALEALAFHLKGQLTRLEQIGHFQAQQLLVVGGGSRNALWNQIKADVLGLPVLAIDEAETTVLGAALYAMTGARLHPTLAAAHAALTRRYTPFQPSADAGAYQTLYKELHS